MSHTPTRDQSKKSERNKKKEKEEAMVGGRTSKTKEVIGEKLTWSRNKIRKRRASFSPKKSDAA